MFRLIIYLVVAGIVGWFLSWLHMPAGWLIGSLLVGMVYRLKIGYLPLPRWLFPFAMALIGANIGLTMKLSMFREVAAYVIPLVISLVAMLVASWLFSRWLARFSALDSKTALFCCVPGGASVMLALSEDYGADGRVVAAFQSARVVVIVLAIPLLAGLFAHTIGAGGSVHPATSGGEAGTTTLFPGFRYLCLVAIVILALVLTRVAKIPAAQFLYAMLIAFVLNLFIVHIGEMPTIIVGIGQVLLGANIGMRFDREALKQLKDIGWLSIGILMLFLVLTFVVSFIFFLLTKLDFVSSLLSMSPGGAPQMSSTAAVLHLDASMVAAVQLIRLLIIFLLLPVVIPYLVKKKRSQENS